MWSVKCTPASLGLRDYTLSFVQAGRSNTSVIQLESEGRSSRGGRLKNLRSWQNDDVEFRKTKKKKKCSQMGRRKSNTENKHAIWVSAVVGVDEILHECAHRSTTLQGHLKATKKSNMADCQSFFSSFQLCVLPLYSLLSLSMHLFLTSPYSVYQTQHPFHAK